MKSIITLILLFTYQISFSQFTAEQLYYNGNFENKLARLSVNDTVRYYYIFGSSSFENNDGVTYGRHPFGLYDIETYEETDLKPFNVFDELNGDTIFVKLFNLPFTPLDSLNELFTTIEDIVSVPAFIEGVETGKQIELNSITIRVPFPDTLFPQVSVVTYPDSADLELSFSYKTTGTRTPHTSTGVDSELILELNLIAIVKPIVGPDIPFTFPILNDFKVQYTYYTNGIGLGRIAFPEYELAIPFSNIGGDDVILMTLPKAEFTYWEMILSNESQKIKPSLFTIDVYPNPFNPQTTIQLQLEESGSFSIDLFDSKGSLVRRLSQKNSFNSGIHIMNLNGTNLSSGVYFIRVFGETRSGVIINQTKRVTLIK